MMWGFILGSIIIGIVVPIIDYIQDKIQDWKYKRNSKIIDEYFKLKIKFDNDLVANGLKDYDIMTTIYSDGLINIKEAKKYIKDAKRKRLCR